MNTERDTIENEQAAHKAYVEWKQGKSDEVIFPVDGFKAGWQAALANKPDAEPVAYAEQDNIDMESYDNLEFVYPVKTKKDAKFNQPLYTAPPSTAALQKRIEELQALISKKDEAEPVYCVPFEVKGHDVLYRHQDKPEPMCDNVVLYTQSVNTHKEYCSQELVDKMREALLLCRDNLAAGAESYRAQQLADAALKAGDVQAPKECTNSDTWNCKYCDKTKTCEALNDPRNFGVPIPAAPTDTEGK